MSLLDFCREGYGLVATLLVGHGVSCLLADLALPMACLLLCAPGNLVIIRTSDRLPAIARVTAANASTICTYDNLSLALGSVTKLTQSGDRCVKQLEMRRSGCST